MIVYIRKPHPEYAVGLHQFEDDAEGRRVIESFRPHAEEVGRRDLPVRLEEFGPATLHPSKKRPAPVAVQKPKKHPRREFFTERVTLQ